MICSALTHSPSTHNISTLVTERRRYKEVLLPFFDLKGDLKESVGFPEDESGEAEFDAKGT